MYQPQRTPTFFNPPHSFCYRHISNNSLHEFLLISFLYAVQFHREFKCNTPCRPYGCRWPRKTMQTSCGQPGLDVWSPCRNTSQCTSQFSFLASQNPLSQNKYMTWNWILKSLICLVWDNIPRELLAKLCQNSGVLWNGYMSDNSRSRVSLCYRFHNKTCASYHL